MKLLQASTAIATFLAVPLEATSAATAEKEQDANKNFSPPTHLRNNGGDILEQTELNDFNKQKQQLWEEPPDDGELADYFYPETTFGDSWEQGSDEFDEDSMDKNFMALFESETEGNKDKNETSIDLGWWTYSTSEERGPIHCHGGASYGVGCSGRYCDNVRMGCRQPPSWWGRRMNSYWTGYVSEEHGALYCASGYYANGLRCSGRYCDNVSFLCTKWSNKRVGRCFWGRSFSEENRYSYSSSYYVRGVKCYGRYCDNKRLYYCL